MQANTTSLPGRGDTFSPSFMSTSARASHLQKTPDCRNCPVRHRSIMAELQDEKLECLDSEKSCNVYRKGDIIFHESNRPMGLYSIFSGKVKVYKSSEIGKDQIIRLAKAGDPLGYRSLISGESYSATAEAIEDSRICFIPKSFFNDVLENGTGVFQRLIRIMTDDLKLAEDRIASMATKTVRERTAEALIMLKNYYGLKPDGQTLDVNLTREDLSNLVGTATESLIRMLAEFKADKLIDLKDRQILILNAPKLAHLANIED